MCTIKAKMYEAPLTDGWTMDDVVSCSIKCMK